MAGEAHGAAAHGAEKGAEAAAGLPQLDPAYFASQVFWLALAFGLLYLLLSQALLPKLGGVLKARGDKISGDIATASAANAAAEEAQAGYEKSLAGAKAEARKLADAARAEAAAERAKLGAELDAKLSARLDAAEARVAASREQGLSAAREAAAEAARDILGKIAGVTVSEDAARKAVGGA